MLTSPPYPPSSQTPTKINVVNLINKVAEEALSKGPDSLFFFMYSGHGTRKPTRYPELGKGSYDEGLCTLTEVLTDVEISDLLENWSMKGLAVFVVLDCCHSGGADRMDGSLGAVKCPDYSTRSNFRDEPNAEGGFGANDQPSPEVSGDEHGRNAVIKRGWFYRTRSHNLLAACQPHEIARETPHGGEYIGVLTYFFHKALTDLYNSTSPVTYEQLTNYIVSVCKKGNIEIPQAPMHLGTRSRLLFGTRILDDVNNSLTASVTEIKGNRRSGYYAYIDKGEGHGIHIGDRFRLYSPGQCRFGLPITGAPHAAEIEVQRAGGTDAKTVFLTEVGEVATGWIACLSKRANLPIVSLIPREQTDVITNLQDGWSRLTLSPGGAPVDLMFHSDPSATTEGTSVVHINVASDNRRLIFLDRQQHEMHFVPSLNLGEADLVRKLAYLLSHLCSYQRLVELQPTRNMPQPEFEFRLVEDDGNNSQSESEDEDDATSLPKGQSYNITFRNNSSDILYVTIFNLGHAYGVTQIFPDEIAASFAVVQDDCIPKLPITIQVPELLRDAAKKSDFQMRDIFKVLVTKEITHFGQYNQSDLEGWGTWDLDRTENGRYRNVKRRKRDRGDFWAQSIEVITTKSDLNYMDGDSIDENNPGPRS
ncbi:caspase domain-containing protein [Astrocystis sublimbata]|nr:caspase domain-containing protein [Astrocystis sublimbata]